MGRPVLRKTVNEVPGTPVSFWKRLFVWGSPKFEGIVYTTLFMPCSSNKEFFKNCRVTMNGKDYRAIALKQTKKIDNFQTIKLIPIKGEK